MNEQHVLIKNGDTAKVVRYYPPDVKRGDPGPHWIPKDMDQAVNMKFLIQRPQDHAVGEHVYVTCDRSTAVRMAIDILKAAYPDGQVPLTDLLSVIRKAR